MSSVSFQPAGIGGGLGALSAEISFLEQPTEVTGRARLVNARKAKSVKQRCVMGGRIRFLRGKRNSLSFFRGLRSKDTDFLEGPIALAGIDLATGFRGQVASLLAMAIEDFAETPYLSGPSLPSPCAQFDRLVRGK